MFLVPKEIFVSAYLTVQIARKRSVLSVTPDPSILGNQGRTRTGVEEGTVVDVLIVLELSFLVPMILLALMKMVLGFLAALVTEVEVRTFLNFPFQNSLEKVPFEFQDVGTMVEMMVVSTDMIMMILILNLLPVQLLALEGDDVWMPMELLCPVMILLPLTVVFLEQKLSLQGLVEGGKGL